MQEQLEERTTETTGLQRTKQRGLSNENARVWRRERAWPVRALTWLLALESVLLAVAGYFNLQGGESVLALLVERPFYATFVPLALLALIATVGFTRLLPGAWVIAMLVQGLMLLTALATYFSAAPRSPVLYVMMVYAVVMVVYLNYAEVPLIFRVQPGTVSEAHEEGEVIP